MAILYIMLEHDTSGTFQHEGGALTAIRTYIVSEIVNIFIWKLQSAIVYDNYVSTHVISKLKWKQS